MLDATPTSRSRPPTPWKTPAHFRAAGLKTGKIVQVGTQRRSTPSYQKADEYIKSGKFGDIVMVEMTWNVNQPGRWRRPDVVPLLKKRTPTGSAIR